MNYFAITLKGEEHNSIPFRTVRAVEHMNAIVAEAVRKNVIDDEDAESVTEATQISEEEYRKLEIF